MASNSKQKLVQAPLPPLKRELPPDEGPHMKLEVQTGRVYRELGFARNLLPDGNPLLPLAVKDKRSGNYTLKIEAENGEYYSDYMSALLNGKLRFKSQEVGQEYNRLLLLYCFGEQMHDKIYQDHVMDALRFCMYQPAGDEFRPKVPDLHCINLIFGKTPAGSLLRKLITHLCAWAGIGRYLSGFQGQDLPHPEFATYLKTTLDVCVRQPQSFKALDQIFRDGSPWPYFHMIRGSTVQLGSREGSALEPIEIDL